MQNVHAELRMSAAHNSSARNLLFLYVLPPYRELSNKPSREGMASKFNHRFRETKRIY